MKLEYRIYSRNDYYQGSHHCRDAFYPVSPFLMWRPTERHQKGNIARRNRIFSPTFAIKKEGLKCHSILINHNSGNRVCVASSLLPSSPTRTPSGCLAVACWKFPLDLWKISFPGTTHGLDWYRIARIDDAAALQMAKSIFSNTRRRFVRRHRLGWDSMESTILVMFLSFRGSPFFPPPQIRGISSTPPNCLLFWFHL